MIGKKILKTLVMPVLILVWCVTPLHAANGNGSIVVQPRFDNVSSASLGISFDTNNVVYVTLNVIPYDHGSGVSGIMKLFNSEGTCIAAWSVSDYVEPIAAEFTHQGEYGETYTATFEGYAYSNNQTAPDRLELSVTGTCRD